MSGDPMETEPSVASRNDQEPLSAPTAAAEAAGTGTSPSAEDDKKENRENQWEPNSVELRRLIEDARGKADAHWNDLLRARAELENVRRRAERDVENAHKFALERFAMELLPVKDSLELGLSAVAETTAAADVTKLREGIDLTLKMLTTAMGKFSIREINPVNERFNPERHQAMTVQPSAAVPPNTVLMVYQKGYTLNERLIRPAMVIVSQAVPPTENGGTGETQKGG
ncbi:Protein GrpE [Gammaproteobacteria bacterium]